MLPTRINVLPPEKKVRLRRMIRSEFIRNILGLCIVVSSIIAIATVGSRAILQTYFFDLAESLNSVTVQSTDKNIVILQANNRISTAMRVIRNQHYWPVTLVDIYTAVPGSVVVSKMTIDKKEGIATITGVASTRDELVNFGAELRMLPFVNTVDIPISQLTQQENISFTIRMILTL
jgi:Tfp pilus assembly protein PilN